MWMVEEMDAGPIFLQERVSISPDDNAGTLAARLADLGGRLLVTALNRLRRGEAIKTPQPQAGVTYAPPLSAGMLLVDFTRDAREVAGWIRGLDPAPGAYTLWRGRRLKLYGGRVWQEAGHPGLPGTVLKLTPGGLEIACGHGSLTVREVQLAGHKRLEAATFLRGHALLGEVLGTVDG
jgi:methionyl-tRNA formyltransferase